MQLQFLKTDAEIVVIDSENEYGPLVQQRYGQVITIMLREEYHTNLIGIVAEYELEDETNTSMLKLILW